MNNNKNISGMLRLLAMSSIIAIGLFAGCNSKDAMAATTIPTETVSIETTAAETTVPETTVPETTAPAASETITTVPSETATEPVEPTDGIVANTDSESSNAPVANDVEPETSAPTPDPDPTEPPAPPVYSGVDVNETVYSTDSLNVRTGPDESYEKIGMLTLNESVTRIKILDNGWSQIDYYGQTAYAFSDYLSYEPVEIPSDGRPRLYIDAVGINVGLTYSSDQWAVDDYDSAAYFSYGMGMMIGDHNYQTFETLPNVIPGSTTARIDFGDHVEQYICTNLITGYNTGHGLYDDNDNSVESGATLIMYTCQWYSDNGVYITMWEPV